MMIRLCLLVFAFSSLIACSSSGGGRAPVTDITSGKSSRSGASGYIAKNSSASQKTYTVKSGDTLYSIAWKTGKDVNYITQRNNIRAPYIIKKGQVLQLTGKEGQYAQNNNSKSDPASQNTTKNSNLACTGQNCNKNKSVAVAEEKTKAYPAKKVDAKATTQKSKPASNAKVSSWSWPVKGKLTKRFSASKSGKQGISIVNKRGSAITASAPGTIVYAGSGLSGYGNLIIIKHNYDYLSAYAHNETLLVRENEQIKKGQKIATMGDSGSDHVQLHFEIRYQGKSVDPLRYLPKQ